MLHRRTLAQLQQRLFVNRRAVINFALLLLDIFQWSANNNRHNTARFYLCHLLFCFHIARHCVSIQINITLHRALQATRRADFQQRHVIIRFRCLEQFWFKIARHLENLLRHAQFFDNFVLRHLVQLRHTDISVIAYRLSFSI